jgi:sulfonate transport system substrate-binding protein
MNTAILSRRGALIAAGAAVLTVRRVRASGRLRVGDQRGGYKSLMEAAGLLDDSVEWSIFAAAAPLLEALNAGAIDVGGAGDAPFAFARAAGVPVRAVSATRSSGKSTALVVAAGSTAKSFADLKGKRIGTGKGSVGHFLTVAAREQAGLQPGDISIVFLSPPDAKAALASGAIDAWATWSQYVYLAVIQDHARILLDGRGLMSGLSYDLAHTDAYAEIWARETRVPLDVAQATLQARGFAPAPINAAMIAGQQRTVDLYIRERLLPGPQDAAAGFDTRFTGPT